MISYQKKSRENLWILNFNGHTNEKNQLNTSEFFGSGLVLRGYYSLYYLSYINGKFSLDKSQLFVTFSQFARWLKSVYEFGLSNLFPCSNLNNYTSIAMQSMIDAWFFYLVSYSFCWRIKIIFLFSYKISWTNGLSSI